MLLQCNSSRFFYPMISATKVQAISLWFVLLWLCHKFPADLCDHFTHIIQTLTVTKAIVVRSIGCKWRHSDGYGWNDRYLTERHQNKRSQNMSIFYGVYCTGQNIVFTIMGELWDVHYDYLEAKKPRWIVSICYIIIFISLDYFELIRHIHNLQSSAWHAIGMERALSEPPVPLGS